MTQFSLPKLPQRYPVKLPQNTEAKYASDIVQTLQKAGFEAYLVGGAVRDVVMGVTPGDFDITTNAKPEDVQELFHRTVPVGIEFGTVIVLQEEEGFEVTTFRAEGSYKDGRHPSEVAFSSHVCSDLERRDFTINGLIYDAATSEVLDYTNGLNDIKAKRISTIGDAHERFNEDHLRMLRAVRFAARLSFEIDNKTFEAIQALAPNIKRISAERIQQELFKILKTPHSARGLSLLLETGLWDQLFPQIQEIPLAQERLTTFEAFRAKTQTVGLPFALMAWELTPSEAEALLLDLRSSTELMKEVKAILQEHPKIADFSSFSMAAQKRFVRQPFFASILLAGYVEHACGRLGKDNLDAIETALTQWNETDLRPPRLLTGHHLKKLGYPPGPLFKEILDGLEEVQLQEIVFEKDQALDWLNKNYGHLRQG